MKTTWGTFWLGSRKWLKTGWLVTAFLIAVYGGVIRPSRAFRGIAMEKTTALAAIERNRHWLLPLPGSVDNATLAAGIIGGVPGVVTPRSVSMMTYSPKSESLNERQVVRTSSIDLLVKSPAEAADKIRSMTEHAGGFLVRLQTNGAKDATNATLTIRVPIARFEEVGAEIRKLGLRVESEQMEAEDVTRQYIDQQARLCNLRAQEAQYLTILEAGKDRQGHTGGQREVERSQGRDRAAASGIRNALEASGDRCNNRVTALPSRSKCVWTSVATFI